MNKVICIVGPTGIGKTRLSLMLAKYLKTEIINADAIQVFKEVDILSAKATKEEQAEVKHHLLDYLDLDENLDIASFKLAATQLIEKLNQQGKIPIVVGGSGLYLKSLLYDYNLTKIKGRTGDVSLKYQTFSNQELFAYLNKIDAKAAEKLHANNRKRVLRAIEIFEDNQVTKSEFIDRQTHQLEFNALIIGLIMPRDLLYERINERVEIMIKNGLLTEVRNLHEKYHDSNYQVFQAIGYKELVPYLNEEESLANCVVKIKQNSRRYAKKQLTWFNNQMPVHWLLSEPDNFEKTVISAKKIVKEFFDDGTTI